MDKEELIEDFKKMALIRQFELRAESAYQQGLIGGFFHSYIGQEAIQTAVLRVFGKEHWYVTSYRCHALAILLGEPINELMAELYGKATGNAKGRGGSMHFFSNRLLGGFGIVGGQVPIATGAAFVLKYQGKKEEIAICFLGEGAVAQGAFHEALNLASLWDLPCLYIIENNRWGMGTAVEKAICVAQIAEKKAPGYNMKSFTFDGMDYLTCRREFEKVKEYMMQERRPVLVEILTERFKGHSISDPALYRTKEALHHCMRRDPLLLLKTALFDNYQTTESELEPIEKMVKAEVIQAMEFAQGSPWPDPNELEKDVFAQ